MAKKIVRVACENTRFSLLFARWGRLRAKRPQRRRARRNGCFRWAGSYLRSVAEL